FGSCRRFLFVPLVPAQRNLRPFSKKRDISRNRSRDRKRGMENRDSAASLSHPVWIGKLSLWSDRGAVPRLPGRKLDRGFAEPFAVLPAWLCRKGRLRRHCLGSLWPQHRGVSRSWDKHGGNR